MLYVISHLKKVFDNRTVLDIPFLEIESGIIYALLGSNGAGKTTLLNILGFLEPPTQGNILYRSVQVIFSTSHLQNLRREVVLVDQNPIMFTTSVFKNVEFGLRIRRIPKNERVKIVTEALDMVGMRHFAQAQAQNLSAGETQRVALARGLVVSPQVLLCDEPTSTVDVEHQTMILNILKQITEERKISIVFTTHDGHQAAFLSCHTLSLDHGKPVYTDRDAGLLD
ncbi:MAG: ATP-binding cassette domain-containing protein [Desulfobacterales bacterium]|jgi:tungstate transport system ATP-binding protein|nr:ATP-binding cassette domain-containing protein [Desulfobacterales bacterium]MDP7354866.1 ATP-binding cassette domain-containing protein [Desulfobacterales bacterium]MDP7417427.1 ATP-binding cassette domain-containing protein [Desulfobacterales bacterium]HJO61678.1 ATP-binding cassette domain-containing protein [Desulfobacterales bacterium]